MNRRFRDRLGEVEQGRVADRRAVVVRLELGHVIVTTVGDELRPLSLFFFFLVFDGGLCDHFFVAFGIGRVAIFRG